MNERQRNTHTITTPIASTAMMTATTIAAISPSDSVLVDSLENSTTTGSLQLLTKKPLLERI